MTTTQHIENYIYEMEGIVLPFNKYDVDNNNMFYYYKQQTPKRSIAVSHEPNKPTLVDIYEDPRYHDIDTDDELDMDDENVNLEVDVDNDDNNSDLLSKLKTYLANIPKSPTEHVSEISTIPTTTSTPKRLTKKNKRRQGKHTKHANRVRPKSSY